MKSLMLSAIAAIAIVNPAIAQGTETRILYEDSEKDYFEIDVEYSKQADGREHCSLALMDRQSENVLSLLVPGSRSEPAFIIFSVPSGFLGLGKAPESHSLVFEFVDENGEKTQSSALGHWDYAVEEVNSTSNTVSHLLLSRVDDLWGFARDWHGSAAVFVENESGEEVGSLTLHRAKEGMEVLADCWANTKD